MKDFRLGIEVKVTAKPVNHKFITPIGAPEEQNNFIEKLTAEANVVATDAELESKVADAIKVISRQWQLATDQPPRISNPQAYDITISSGSIKCLVDSLGLSTTVTLEYGSTPELGTSTEASSSPLSGGSPEEVSWDLSDLQVEQTIYYRIKAVSSAGTVYTHLHSFTTLTTPLIFQFDYTGEEQFRFLFKAPATKSITLEWGDGTSETIAGADDTYVDRTSSYTQKKKYNFKVTGDVVSITSFRSIVPCYPFIRGDVSRWGEMSDIDTAYFGFPQDPCPGLYGDITSIRNWTKLVNFYITSDGVTGDLSQLDQFTTDLYIISVHSKKVRFANVATWDGLDGAYLSFNYLSSKGVDNLIASTKGSVNCQIAAFLSEERTLASNQDLLESVENNNAVFVREDDVIMPLGDELHTDANAVSDPNGNEANATTGWVATGLDAPNEFVSQSSVKKTGSYAFKTNANPNPTSGAKITYTKTVEAGKLFRAGILWKALDFDNYRKDWELNFDGRSLNSYVQRDWKKWAAYVKASSTSLVTFIKEDGSTNAGGVYIDSFSLREVITSPIVLQIEFNGTDQFNFKFKAPATSTLDIYDGDGTTTNVAGQDDTLVTHTTDYSEPGTYTFFVDGDWADITYLNVSAQDFVYGSIARFNELVNLTFVNVGGTNIIGDVSVFADITVLEAIYFPLSRLTGDLSSLKDLASLSFVYGQGNFSFTSPDEWASSTSFAVMGDFSSSDIDNIISAFKNASGIKITLIFNEPRTTASDDDLITLVNNGNYIYLHEPKSPFPLGPEKHTDANAASDNNGNEANAITGWTEQNLNGTGRNVFASQKEVKYKGKYALKASSQPTPTSGAEITKEFTFSQGDVGYVKLAIRHIGEGKAWLAYPGYNTNAFIFSHLTTFRECVAYQPILTADPIEIRLAEASADNNGGMYLDDVSVRKVITSPIALEVKFDGTNQFEFDFKAPSTSTLTFYDGDGTITEVDGNDATEVTHTTDYSEPGVYTFYVEGDLSDITELKINNQSFVSGSINRFGELSSLIDLNVSGTGFDGNLENILNLTSLETFYVAGTKVTGDVSELAVLTSLDGLVVYQSEVFGDFSKLYPLTLIYQIFSFDQPGTSFENIETWDFSALATMQFHNNAWSSEDVDNCLISLANGGASGANIKLDGNNDTRTSASDAALSTLLAAGNTVIVNYDQSPIMFTVNYTDTQFQFKFKLPSTKRIIVNEGDGTFTTIVGQDDTYIIHETTYTEEGEYQFIVDGDYANLTNISIIDQENVTGSISRWNELVDVDYVGVMRSPGISGDFNKLGLLSNLESFQISKEQTLIRGNIEVLLPLSLDSMSAQSLAITGDVSQLWELPWLAPGGVVVGKSSVTWDTVQSFDPGGGFIAIDCNWTSEMVDNCLISIANGGMTSGVVLINGNNAPRTTASDAAMSTLLEDGNTVDVNFDSPVWYDVEYTDTQFQFKFKLPATKYVEIHDGDGTRTVIQGQDGTLITHNTTYTSPGKYRFYVDGAVRSLTELRIGGQAFVSGDATRLGELTDLEDLHIWSTGVSGNIRGWRNATSLFDLNANFSSLFEGDIRVLRDKTDLAQVALSGTSVEGNIRELEDLSSLLYLDLSNTNTHGDIGVLSARTAILRVNLNGTQVSGDLSDLSVCTALDYLWVHKSQVTFDNIVNLTVAIEIDASDCGWTTTMVDNCLISLDNAGTSGATINIGGKNASRSPASDDALISLLQAGNTVEVNYDSPVKFEVFYDGVTQFDFKFKLPSTKYLNIHDGDGTETLIQGQDDTLITHTTAYTASGYYNFYVDGHVNELRNINVINQPVSFNIEPFADLENLYLLFAAATINEFSNAYGNIEVFAKTSTLIYLSFSGPNVYGDISKLSSLPLLFSLSLQQTNCTFENVVSLPSTLAQLFFYNCPAMTSEMIDNYIKSWTAVDSRIYCWGAAGKRTEASNSAMQTILQNGNRVTIDDDEIDIGILGSELHTDANAVSDPNGNETNATTGWTPVNLGAPNSFESQDVETYNGDYAFKIDANPNPTSGAGIYKEFTVTAGNIYRLLIANRHSGEGDSWQCTVENGTAFYMRAYNSYDQKWRKFKVYYKAPDTAFRIDIKEAGITDSGSVFVDDISFKEVTFP